MTPTKHHCASHAACVNARRTTNLGPRRMRELRRRQHIRRKLPRDEPMPAKHGEAICYMIGWCSTRLGRPAARRGKNQRRQNSAQSEPREPSMQYVRTSGIGYSFTDNQSEAMEFPTAAQAQKLRDRLARQFPNYSWALIAGLRCFYLTVAPA